MVRPPQPVKLLVPMLAQDTSLLEHATARLAEQFGPVDFASEPIAFTFTDYYRAELGSGLWRQFVAFEDLISPEELPGIKLYTNALEQEWANAAGQRQVNLDPGYLTPAKLVLATTKDYAHRVYIGKGIYAEVTLSFRDRDYRPLPWTYPDYQSGAYLNVLRAIRKAYMAQLRQAQASMAIPR